MVSMNKLSTAKRVAVVSALVEGCSIRSTVRMTGVSKNTIAKLLVELGAACTKYQDETLRNAFSKKVENHAAAIAVYFMYYNFGRVHQTLRVTPAMEAGVTNHVWSVAEIVALLA